MTTSYARHALLLAESKERFARETASHELTILHDDGLYRHIRCATPGRAIHRFDLITWPGHLTITGDVESALTFRRADDMFAFFRGAGDINPGYWAEKLVGDRRALETYSMDLFRLLVDEHVTDAVEADVDLAPVDDDQPGLAAAVEAALTDEFNHEDADGAQEFLQRFRYRYADRAGVEQEFRFVDAWEWDLAEWHWSYLWACHAIRWGVGRYDAAKAEPLGELVEVAR
ncbi:hypothetical protein [Dactylosporangium sp. CA-139066]|uniref:hypothetical protein n=1 Tax=Dactylosporangium sp. CA-139066 TaxID=3239930 RepID=UPI003D9114DF